MWLGEKMMITRLITLVVSLSFSPQVLNVYAQLETPQTWQFELVHSLSHYSCIQKVLLMMSFAMADFSPIFPLNPPKFKALTNLVK